MKKKDNNSKIISILILIFIIILISLYSITQKENLNFQDDLIFFKLWSLPKKSQEESIEEINKKTQQYKIKVSNNSVNHKTINLLNTIDTKTLVNEKIAPGTKGNFEIILTSNCTLKYQIELKDKNEKPRNFEFYIKDIEGEIKEGEKKKIPVQWEWKYEINNAENKQDTKDGENIKQYNFEICIIGK